MITAPPVTSSLTPPTRRPGPRPRRGVALVYLTVALTLLCGIASLAVDVGRVYAVKNDLQTVADAAARAAAQVLATGGPAAARKAAADVAALNKIDGKPVTINASTAVQIMNWNPDTRSGTVLTGAAEATGNAVRVTLARTKAGGDAVSLTFGRVIGLSTCDVNASTTACAPGNSSTYAIIGINALNVTGNGEIDSYDSRNLPYKAATAGDKGSIASNGNITLGGSAAINGDARAGVGKTTTLGGSAAVTGRVAPLAAPLKFPSVTLPNSYIDAGDCVMSGGSISLPGGVYVFDTIDLSGNAHVTWQSPVVFYVRKAYSVKGNVVIDTYKNIPANRVIKFLPTCKTATWTGTHSCVGDLYAPDTDFTIGGNAELFGRIIAKTINLSSSGNMHYDEALPPAGSDGAASPVTVVK
jgi:Flp pilus assembly protein TadG